MKSWSNRYDLFVILVLSPKFRATGINLQNGTSRFMDVEYQHNSIFEFRDRHNRRFRYSAFVSVSKVGFLPGVPGTDRRVQDTIGQSAARILVASIDPRRQHSRSFSSSHAIMRQKTGLYSLCLFGQLSYHLHDLRFIISHNYHSSQCTSSCRLSFHIPALPFIQSTVYASISFIVQSSAFRATYDWCLELSDILLQLVQSVVSISRPINDLARFSIACVFKYSPQLIPGWYILCDVQLKFRSLKFVLVCMICSLVFRCCF